MPCRPDWSFKTKREYHSCNPRERRKDARTRWKEGMGRRGEGVAAPARAASLEGAQEGDELILLRGAQTVEVVRHGLSFVAVTLNGVKESDSTAVVQQLRARTHPPKRRRAHFMGCFLAAGLHDAVPSADVMKQEVAVGMNDLVAEGIGHDEGARGDSRSRWRRCDRRDMTN